MRGQPAAARPFYDALVEMPIVAVTELAKEGDAGSEVRFRIQDGEIIDNLTGKRCQSVKRTGVYFMHIYFPKSACGHKRSEGFGRPDR